MLGIIPVKLLKVSHYLTPVEWGSERLLLNANSAIFQLYYGENKLIFDEMLMSFALLWREQVNFRWDVDEFRFVLDKHASIFLLYAVCLAEKQQIPIL
jgi:hypothetical protein